MKPEIKKSIKQYFSDEERLSVYFEGGNGYRSLTFDNKLYEYKDPVVKQHVIDYMYDLLVDMFDVPKHTEGFTMDGDADITLEGDDLIINVNCNTYDPEDPDLKITELTDDFKIKCANVYEKLNSFLERENNFSNVIIKVESFYLDYLEIVSLKDHGLEYELEDIFYTEDLDIIQSYKKDIVSYFQSHMLYDDDKYEIEISMSKSNKDFNLDVHLRAFFPVEQHFTDTFTHSL